MDRLRADLDRTGLNKGSAGFPASKIRYIAYEYKKGVNLPLNYLRHVLSEDCYMGCISYSREREIYRNTGSSYCSRLAAEGAEEYLRLLSRFNIVVRTYKGQGILKYFTHIKRF